MKLTRTSKVRQWGRSCPLPSSTLTSSSPNTTKLSSSSSPPLSPQNQEILKAVTKLGNTVLSNKAAADLNLLKSKKAPGLKSPELFQKVLGVLSSHRYKLPACRFVLDLFERSVLRKLVLEEDDDEEEEEVGVDGKESEDEKDGNGFEGAFGGGVGGV